jgi:hypothetical protein
MREPGSTGRVNPPGVSGDSSSWEGWSHVWEHVEEVPSCEPFKWTVTADEIIDQVRKITTHMERLTNAVQIADVADSDLRKLLAGASLSHLSAVDHVAA